MKQKRRDGFSGPDFNSAYNDNYDAIFGTDKVFKDYTTIPQKVMAAKVEDYTIGYLLKEIEGSHHDSAALYWTCPHTKAEMKAYFGDYIVKLNGEIFVAFSFADFHNQYKRS